MEFLTTESLANIVKEETWSINRLDYATYCEMDINLDELWMMIRALAEKSCLAEWRPDVICKIFEKYNIS